MDGEGHNGDCVYRDGDKDQSQGVRIPQNACREGWVNKAVHKDETLEIDRTSLQLTEKYWNRTRLS